VTNGTDAGALFKAGQLDQSVAAATEAVRKAPTDLGPRLLLCELLLFQGRLDRIDTLLDAASTLDPSTGVGVAEFRQLLRGEIARRQLMTEARVPDFLGEPTASQRAALAALVALRVGDIPAALAAVAEAEAARPHPVGQMGDAAYDDLRDADDILCGSLEVLTTTGKYFWVPFERVMSMQPHPPQRPRDLFWRRATLAVADGPTGEVYLPALYDTPDTADTACRLGRATDWVEVADGLVRGVGQKVLIVGEEGVPLLQLGALESP
jgi:type VI secretion system protein ImpE